MNRRRATVVIRQPDPDADPGTDGLYREWVHLDEFDRDGLGVTLRWLGDGVETFVPWASVVRVDFGPCCCVECERPR